MKNLFRFLPGVLISVSLACGAQEIRSRMEQIKSAYSASGSILILDNQTLVIEPNMPGPVCALPRKEEDGKLTWYRYAFPLASITVPLSEVDETLMSEDRVFTDPGAPQSYKPGDMGDATMVVIVGMPGKRFHTLIYDRDKLAHLGPGPHNSSEYGQVQDEVEAFGLTFRDDAAERAFVSALRNAVVLAKAEALAAPSPNQPHR